MVLGHGGWASGNRPWATGHVPCALGHRPYWAMGHKALWQEGLMEPVGANNCSSRCVTAPWTCAWECVLQTSDKSVCAWGLQRPTSHSYGRCPMLYSRWRVAYGKWPMADGLAHDFAGDGHRVSMGLWRLACSALLMACSLRPASMHSCSMLIERPHLCLLPMITGPAIRHSHLLS